MVLNDRMPQLLLPLEASKLQSRIKVVKSGLNSNLPLWVTNSTCTVPYCPAYQQLRMDIVRLHRPHRCYVLEHHSLLQPGEKKPMCTLLGSGASAAMTSVWIHTYTSASCKHCVHILPSLPSPSLPSLSLSSLPSSSHFHPILIPFSFHLTLRGVTVHSSWKVSLSCLASWTTWSRACVLCLVFCNFMRLMQAQG